MPLAIVQVDAFADRPFAGNPAAVCVLPHAVPDPWMQDVAAEMNLAETAFLLPEADGGFHLRWFTPAVEVDLCGHATLASAHVLWESGRLGPAEPARFSTRSGRLTATPGDDGWITLDFPIQPIADAPTAMVEGAVEALGLGTSDFGAARMGGADLLVEVASASVVRGVQPNLGGLLGIKTRGVVVTARSDRPEFDFVSRWFGPSVGVDEDPVTGSAHCALGPYWAEKLGKSSLVGFQASRRGGVVRVELVGDRALLGGRAVTVLRGELADAAAPPAVDGPAAG